MHVSIREARPSDIDAVFALMLELIRAEDDASRKTHESLLDLRVKRDDFARSAREELFAEFEEPNTRFIVAIIDETIVGYARAEVVETSDPFFKPVKRGYVHALCVGSSYRGQGIASELYGVVESWLEENGCTQVHLEVFDANEASRIYERWGYTRYITRMVKEI
jgi:ribosomal protein S18 acetylase RimI-like enzyme